jgi:hypothetical protein
MQVRVRAAEGGLHPSAAWRTAPPAAAMHEVRRAHFDLGAGDWDGVTGLASELALGGVL